MWQYREFEFLGAQGMTTYMNMVLSFLENPGMTAASFDLLGFFNPKTCKIISWCGFWFWLRKLPHIKCILTIGFQNMKNNPETINVSY